LIRPPTPLGLGLIFVVVFVFVFGPTIIGWSRTRAIITTSGRIFVPGTFLQPVATECIVDCCYINTNLHLSIPRVS
jgi:hypothetical protein